MKKTKSREYMIDAESVKEALGSIRLAPGEKVLSTSENKGKVTIVTERILEEGKKLLLENQL